MDDFKIIGNLWSSVAVGINVIRNNGLSALLMPAFGMLTIERQSESSVNGHRADDWRIIGAYDVCGWDVDVQVFEEGLEICG